MKNFAITEKNYIYCDIFMLYLNRDRNCVRKVGFFAAAVGKCINRSASDDFDIGARGLGGLNVSSNEAPHPAAEVAMAGSAGNA